MRRRRGTWDLDRRYQAVRGFVTWPSPSGRDIAALVALVGGGSVVARLVMGAAEPPPRAGEECVVSGTVVKADPLAGESSRPYAGLRVGAVRLPASYKGPGFDELGVADGKGAFRVSCAGVTVPSQLGFADPAWGPCLHVSDVVIERDGVVNARVEISELRMTDLGRQSQRGRCQEAAWR